MSILYLMTVETNITTIWMELSKVNRRQTVRTFSKWLTHSCLNDGALSFYYKLVCNRLFFSASFSFVWQLDYVFTQKSKAECSWCSWLQCLHSENKLNLLRGVLRNSFEMGHQGQDANPPIWIIKANIFSRKTNMATSGASASNRWPHQGQCDCW